MKMFVACFFDELLLLFYKRYPYPQAKISAQHVLQKQKQQQQQQQKQSSHNNWMRCFQLNV